jgi:peptidoglycan/xylan/chitin deacetylase (PgdA/CDA1 family)
MKHAAHAMSRTSGQRDILVLCYHSVSPSWPAATNVTPQNLDAQLSHFVHRGYRGATLRDALTAPRDARTLVVTFDDAFHSILGLAFPILDRLGIPGTVYVPTAYPDSEMPMAWEGYDRWLGTPHEHELACMSWHELRTLDASGWEIASHTDSHPRLTTLDDVSLRHELGISRERCEREIQKPCYSFAYPYSDHDSRVVEATREAGYLLGVTVALGSETPLPLQWPRIVVAHGDTALRLQVRAWRRARPSAEAAWRTVKPFVRRVGTSGRPDLPGPQQ